MYKAKLVEETDAQLTPKKNNGILESATMTVPLKHLSNFRRSLKIFLINIKVELKLKWMKRCV